MHSPNQALLCRKKNRILLQPLSFSKKHTEKNCKKEPAVREQFFFRYYAATPMQTCLNKTQNCDHSEKN